MRVLQESVTTSADPELARTLLGIQHAAYALEATLIDDDRIPALHEHVEGRRIVESTGRHNAPASSSYEQLGLLHMRDVEVIPGLWVTRYSWTAG
jgi:hypothetical protein